MQYKLALALLIFFSVNQVSAKLNNNYEQNLAQYGQPVEVKDFPSKLGFTGYVTYSLDNSWRLKAFFLNDKVKMEHLFPQPHANPNLNREEVKNWALKMFELGQRGPYVKEVNQAKVQGHFFQKGLVAYENNYRGKAKIGFRGVRVMFYEDGKNFSKAINPRAYL